MCNDVIVLLRTTHCVRGIKDREHHAAADLRHSHLFLTDILPIIGKITYLTLLHSQLKRVSCHTNYDLIHRIAIVC